MTESMRILAALGAVVVAACSADAMGDPFGGGGGGPPSGDPSADAGPPLSAQDRAKQAFTDLYPDMNRLCGALCHDAGLISDAPRWLLHDDPYKAIRDYDGMITKDVYASKLLVKPHHVGPSLTYDATPPEIPALKQKVVHWLALEAVLLDEAALPSSDPIFVRDGDNTFDLTKAGAPGARVRFTAKTGGAGEPLALTAITLEAPPATGVRIVHPIVLVVSPDQHVTREPGDHFSNLDLTVNAAATQALGDGELFIVDWNAGNQLRLAVTHLDPVAATPDAGTGGGGCKALPEFVQFAVPTIQREGCPNCHGGANPGATSALDMTQLGKDNAATCAQALLRVDLSSKDKSPILVDPPGRNNHPPIVQDEGNFDVAMHQWIDKE
jgi:hypothetical protein